jgi:hypothetical protein
MAKKVKVVSKHADIHIGDGLISRYFGFGPKKKDKSLSLLSF